MRIASNIRSPIRPLDFLRTRFTRGIAITVENEELRRGDEVEAVVTISAPKKLQHVAAGIVCTESYAVTVGSDGAEQGNAWSTLHEQWTQIGAVPEPQIVRFRLPVDGPFSYEGVVLSFTWEVIVRSSRRWLLDIRANAVLSVLP